MAFTNRQANLLAALTESHVRYAAPLIRSLVPPPVPPPVRSRSLLSEKMNLEIHKV